MVFRILGAVAASFLLAACATLPQPASLEGRAPAQPGVVSAADPRAAEAGAEMLRAGGSATDAAIATMLALTVVEPQSSGIGGGGFYVRATPDGAVETIDGRETAPATATPQWFLDAAGKPLDFRAAVLSGKSVGVPGNIALARDAHRKHGLLSWARLFAPAITLAERGWQITPRGREFLIRAKHAAARDPAGLALFYDAAGEPLPVGTTVRNPALAKSLRRIAKGGADSFYKGPLARQIADKVLADTPGGTGMTRADMAGYAAKERAGVCGTYRAYRICGMGPPSSGATTVLAILGQLERFDMAALGANSPVAWHLFAESQRLAYADRDWFLADPGFVTVPVERLTDPAYLKARGGQILPDRTMPTVTAGLRELAHGVAPGVGPAENGTSHFVVIGREGDAVSYTSTIESGFGSGLVVGGFYLNNELTDFSFVPEKDGKVVVNRVEAGKRPRSSMAPTVVFAPDGSLFMAVGAAGGATIPVQVSKVLIGVIDFGLPLDAALALPVLYSPGDTVTVEKGSSLEAMIPALEALGHAKVTSRELPLKANAAIRRDGRWIGGADPRSEGRAISE